MSKTNSWINRFNNVDAFATNVNTVGFATFPRLGFGGSGHNMHGYISELMIFDRELSAAERGALATNYFNQRFNLW